jgi:2-methylcitrate dehydratase PrpD
MAETLAGFAADFDLETSPARDDLLEKAKRHILDGIGVALISTTMEDQYAQKLAGVVGAYQSAPACTIIGFSERAAPPLAALLNGALVHGCEFDDRYLEHVVHTESFAVPTALAVTEDRRLNGWALAEGWILAAEVAIRLARGPVANFNGSGFHTTPTCGSIGAAAGAAKLMGLDADRVADAVSLAVSFTSGTSQGWNDGSGRNKSIQPGWAAMSGITAALLAEAGYECSHTTLDGPAGFFAAHAWAEGWRAEPVVEDLGTRWHCLDVAFKIYTTGGMYHNPLECTRDLVLAHDIKPDEVERVEVEIASQYTENIEREAARTAANPRHSYMPGGPGSVARMIMSRALGPEHLTATMQQDPAFRALVDKVTFRPGAEKDYPAAERPTRVVITTTRGTFEITRRKSVGSADEVDQARIVEKFRRNAGYVLPAKAVDEIVELIVNLEQLDDVRRLMPLLVPDRTEAPK